MYLAVKWEWSVAVILTRGTLEPASYLSKRGQFVSNFRCQMKSHFALVLLDDAGTKTRIKNKLSGLLITRRPAPLPPSGPCPLKVVIFFSTFPYFKY